MALSSWLWVSLLLLVAAVAGEYHITDDYQGETFFDYFSFYDGSDPTHGFVYYVNKEQAFDWGLVSVDATTGQVLIKADSWSVSNSSGRASVRIESAKTWNSGVFVIDLDHMPAGCGTWPAWWMCGADWPDNGEVDIIEGVNTMISDQTTLHTNEGCEMSDVPTSGFTGYWSTGEEGQPATDCYVQAADQWSNQGCGILTTETYTFGTNFNNIGGGVYALLWNETAIASYFFLHGQVPQDLQNDKPDPNTWGLPYALFLLGEACPPEHFNELQLILDLTFCGDWAGGSNFESACPRKGSCEQYVQNNPAKFAESYWAVNYVKVYQSN